MVKLLEEFGVGCSIIAVGFLEAIAVSWFYGNDGIVKSCTFLKWKLVNCFVLFLSGISRFSSDIQAMLGKAPGLFWRVCWVAISPAFLAVRYLRCLYHRH